MRKKQRGNIMKDRRSGVQWGGDGGKVVMLEKPGGREGEGGGKRGEVDFRGR